MGWQTLQVSLQVFNRYIVPSPCSAGEIEAPRVWSVNRCA